MKTVKVSELSGAALDWAVAQIDPACNGLKWKPRAESRLYVGFAMIDSVMQPCAYLSNGCCLSEKVGMQRNHVQAYSPSTNWSQCGPLIERFTVAVDSPRQTNKDCWQCQCWDNHSFEVGQTPLMAACRAIVAAKLGVEVEVPEELL